MEEKNNNKNYITLVEAAKLCSYSEPYLRLRARQGKLKSIKLGKKWMTTASWLDDYGLRVQEWRESMAAKKAGMPAAAFVVAPAEITGVLAPIDSPAETDDIIKESGEEQSSLPVAVFCDYKTSMLPPAPKRRIATFAGAGQIFPTPKQDPAENISGYGWFGALLSGAACALILFLAVAPGGFLNNSRASFGQASVSQGIISGREGVRDIPAQIPAQIPAATEPLTSFSGSMPIDFGGQSILPSPAAGADPRSIPYQFLSRNPLKDLVAAIAVFLGGQ